MAEPTDGRPMSVPSQASRSHNGQDPVPNPEPLTLPYRTASVLGQKRVVSGTFAHTLANGPKAPKVSNAMENAPAHQLTSLYDLEHRNQRHGLLKEARATLKAQQRAAMQQTFVVSQQPTSANGHAYAQPEANDVPEFQLPFLQPRPPSGRQTARLPPRPPSARTAPALTTTPVTIPNFSGQTAPPQFGGGGPPAVGQEFVSPSPSQYGPTAGPQFQAVGPSVVPPSTVQPGMIEAVRWFARESESLDISAREAEDAWRKFSQEDRGEILRKYAQATARQNIAASELAFSAVATRRIVASGNHPHQAQLNAHQHTVPQQEFPPQPAPASYTYSEQFSVQPQIPPQHASQGQYSYPQQPAQPLFRPQQPIPPQQVTPAGHGFQQRELPRPPQDRVPVSAQQQPMVQDPRSMLHQQPMTQDPHSMLHQQPMTQDPHSMLEYERVPPPRLSPFSLPPAGDGSIAQPQPSRPIDISETGAYSHEDSMMDADAVAMVTAMLPFSEDTEMGLAEGPSASGQDKGKGRAVDEDSNMGVPNPSVPRPGPAASQQRAGAQPQPAPYPGMSVPDMSQRPTQRPVQTFPEMFTSETAVFFMGQIQGVKEALAEQKESQAQLMQELHTFMATYGGSAHDGAGPSRSAPTGDEHATPYFETKRDRKLNAPTVREKKRSARISKKAARLRGSHVPGDDDGNDADNEGAPELLEDQHKCRLRARVRHLLEQMLHIDDWSTVAAQYPPLTGEQAAAYKKRDGSFVVDARNYRIDFKASWKKFPLNKEARSIFIDHYLARVAGGAYFQNPSPPHMLTRENLGTVLDSHMDYCRKRWRRSDKPLDPEKLLEIARKAAETGRRRTIHEARGVVIKRRPELRRHTKLFDLLEPCNMSGDETDGETKTHPPVWRIRISLWQSRQLRQFLWARDRDYRDDWEKPVHRRAMGGNIPRTRIFRAGCTEEGTAPIGLWRNCYDQEWLEQQPPHIVREMEIIQEDYDFGLPRSDGA